MTLKAIPLEPGCYLMKDKDDRLLYVGKSKILRNRVKSYFLSNNKLSPRINLMVRQITSIEIIVTDNESEALVLESNLIKNNKPHFNILLKDDKKYPYLCITWSEDYPRVFITRRRIHRKDKDRFYGPYVDVTLLRQTLSLVKRYFPLRQRPRPLYKDRTCLNFSIGRCPGVCQKKISSKDYHHSLRRVEMIFQGRNDALKLILEEQMKRSSDNLNFEEAALIRDQIKALKQLNEQQKMASPDSTINRDVIALASDNRLASVQLFQMREGKLIGRLAFTTDSKNLSQGMIIQLVIEEHYGHIDTIEIPSEILIQYELPQLDLITYWLRDLKGSQVRIIEPKRQAKAELIDLAHRNALYELERLKKGEEKQVLALEDLAQLLELVTPPRRIEGYDISHIQGSDPVGSQVVFIDGIPAKQHYRKYKITSSSINIGHSDDFMAMAEVIRRRFRKWSRIKKETGNLSDYKFKTSSVLERTSFDDWPDLIMIDGGKGQLSAVIEALRELDLVDEINICSLAKKREEVFVPEKKESLFSEPDQLGVLLLRRLRDEAHRFAINYHRQLRSSHINRSRLSDIPGLGPKRKKEILSHFKSVEAIQLASIDELIQVPGLGLSMAQNIWDYFHPD